VGFKESLKKILGKGFAFLSVSRASLAILYGKL
jgi:hypothetical protein